jgi:hypothetical protein
MSVRRSHDRRHAAAKPKKFTLDQMRAQVGGNTRKCAAVSGAGLVPPLMRCPGPCPRCADLVQEFEDAAPQREAARQAYDAAQSKKATPQPPTYFPDTEEL